MTPAGDLLASLLATRSECERLEFKEAKNQIDHAKLLAYCVAMANEGGGILVLGISDQLPRRVVGSNALQSPEKTKGQILEKLRLRVEIEEIQTEGGRVVVLTIPGRPLGTAYSLDGAYLMRSGESLVPMSEDRLRAIFNEGKPSWSKLPARTSCSGEEIVLLLETQTYFDLLKIPYPSTREGVLERLQSERIIEKVGSGWTITNLGALVLAKRLADFEVLARKAPRVIVYEGSSKVATQRERTGAKGYAVGFQGLADFVESQTPANEVIEQALRRETRMFPPIALRELLANALIHQDFSVDGASVMVEIFDNRIEISNPGQPTVKTDRFIDEYRSRNEELADLMRRLGICEEKGSGIDKVVQAAEVYQLPAPEFRTDEVRTTCILFGPRRFEEMGRDDRIRACYQHCCLKYVCGEKASNQTLRSRFGLPDERAETVSRILRETVEVGLIKLEDPAGLSRRFVRYLPYWA